jgi:hypothetical protein
LARFPIDFDLRLRDLVAALDETGELLSRFDDRDADKVVRLRAGELHRIADAIEDATEILAKILDKIRNGELAA